MHELTSVIRRMRPRDPHESGRAIALVVLPQGVALAGLVAVAVSSDRSRAGGRV